MKHHRDFQVTPVFRVGDRLFLVMARRSCTQWKNGVIGGCTPVVLVAVDHDACTAWQLHDDVTPEELQEVLGSVAGVPR